MVLLSAQDLESLEATIELLSDESAVERIRQADAAIAAGKYTTEADMTLLMDAQRAK